MNKLVEPEPKNVARRRRSSLPARSESDPEIEQCQIAQDAVEKLEGESAVGLGEPRIFEQLVNDRVGESFAVCAIRARAAASATAACRHERDRASASAALPLARPIE